MLARAALLVAAILTAACYREESVPATKPPPCAKEHVAVVTADAGAAVAVSGDARLDQLRQFVRFGYGDLHDLEVRSLDFHTEELSTAELQELVKLVPDYNAFNGAAIAKGLDELRGEIMHFTFGREGSPVIYVDLAFWLGQQEKACPGQRCAEGWGKPKDDRRLTAAEHAAIVTRVKSVFTRLHADEIDVDEQNDHRIRVWWD